MFRLTWIVVSMITLSGCGKLLEDHKVIVIDDTQNQDVQPGIHSADGWRGNLPIKVYVSKEILNSTKQELVQQDGSDDEVTDTQILQMIRNAMDTWEEAIEVSRGGLFTIVNTTSYVGSNFKRLYDPLKMSFNGLYYDFDWENHTQKPSEVLATTMWNVNPYKPTSIQKMNVRYNSKYYVFGDSVAHTSRNPNKTIVDLESLSLHELGHALGLSHVKERNSVMKPSMHIGEYATMRVISDRDKERLRWIYRR